MIYAVVITYINVGLVTKLTTMWRWEEKLSQYYTATYGFFSTFSCVRIAEGSIFLA